MRETPPESPEHVAVGRDRSDEDADTPNDEPTFQVNEIVYVDYAYCSKKSGYYKINIQTECVKLTNSGRSSFFSWSGEGPDPRSQSFTTTELMKVFINKHLYEIHKVAYEDVPIDVRDELDKIGGPPNTQT